MVEFNPDPYLPTAEFEGLIIRVASAGAVTHYDGAVGTYSKGDALIIPRKVAEAD